MINSLKIRVSDVNHKIDWFSFNQVYSPLLDKDSTLLFMNLVSQAKINTYMKVDNCDYSKFINNYKLTDESINESLTQLEKINLISISDTENERVIEIEDVKSINDFMKDKKLHQSLKEVLTEDKYLELVYITGVSEISKKQNVELDKQVYASFYNGVFSLLGSDFVLCDQALEIIKTHSESISMEDLHRLAYMSIVKVNGKYKVSGSHLAFLIDKQLSDVPDEFNLDAHREFWSNIKVSSEEDINKDFNDLFSKYDSCFLYQLLTGKDKTPDNLQKWIRGYVQDKGCQYPVINALMSFVMSLIGKLPVNYLVKVSNTLASDYSINKVGLMKLARNVIDSDIRNGKNRLNAKVPNKEQDKPVKKTNNSDFVWYFANK